MSATLATILKELDPSIRILIVERLDGPGLESSAARNNAGTGHAANCELNYTPEGIDGRIDPKKALAINSSFERSLEFWSSLVEKGRLSSNKFLNVLPHISFVSGQNDVDFLFKRQQILSRFSAFKSMKFSMDREELNQWAPLVMEGRNPEEVVAGTIVERGVDVDFGSLTKSFIESLKSQDDFEVAYCSTVVDLFKIDKERWTVKLKSPSGPREIITPFIFLGAGGGALTLLQKSSIKEGSIYAGFPVSGQWLICSEKKLTNKHHAKVYGKPKVGAPPMSVPHLDTRWINGERSLLFGPFAGFSGKFLKYGSRLDLLRSLRVNNISSIFQVGLKNLDLVSYLANQLMQAESDRFKDLKRFFPNAQEHDWELSIAGQRVQIIKATETGGELKMGTEVVTSSDGSLAALLGASPGASTAVTIMLEVLHRCWRHKISSDSWMKRLKLLLPSYGEDLNANDELLNKMRKRSDALLDLI